MIWLIAIVFHAALIWTAYKIGENNAGKGIVLFVVGVIGFQLVVNGPASFVGDGCAAYGPRAMDC